MSRMKQETVISTHSLILLVILASAPWTLSASGGSIEVPENAHKKNYGNGWECDLGYRKVDEACIAIEVPANAYPTNTSFGRGWECSYGYRKDHESCLPIKVPPNAYLDTPGDSWKCNRGFREFDTTCVAIKVPANGYLTNSWSGPGWKCDRGSRAIDEACVAVRVPENAHLNYSGNDWECNRPYLKKQKGCVFP